MVYRVVYGEDPFEKPKQSTGRLRLMTAGCALAFVVGVRCMWPQGTEILRQVMLPTENASTAAFRQMTADMQAGEPLGDAVEAFCRAVVEDAVGSAD